MQRNHKERAPRRWELSRFYLETRVGRWRNLRRAPRLFKVPACVLRRRTLAYRARHRNSLDN
jgi:hypothetical protein